MRSLLLSALLFVTAALAAASDSPRELDWLELMPADEVEALNNAPPISHDGNIRMEQQGSFRTIAGLDGQLVKLPGYIVPVEVGDDQTMSSFFLVPYFGACIHVPPPPPNQIVFVTLKEPIPMTQMYDAFWIEGTLRVRTVHKDLAAAAYTLEAHKVSLYEG